MTMMLLETVWLTAFMRIAYLHNIFTECVLAQTGAQTCFLVVC